MIASAGWDGLLSRFVSAARAAVPDAAAVLESLLSMAGTIPLEHGLGSLTRESRALAGLLWALPCSAEIGDSDIDAGGVPIGVAPNGRTFLVVLPEGAEPVARIRGATDDAARTLGAAVERWRAEREAAEAERTRLRDWLTAHDRDEVDRRVGLLEYVLQHMAPLKIYVGDSCFTNLGKGNLPGRSVGVRTEANVLRRLRSEPIEKWTADEAAFVSICWILMASGPQSRLEEANGVCLDLHWLCGFLEERAARYDLKDQPPQDFRDIDALLDFGTRIADCRGRMLLDGRIFYREIHGVNLNKEEKLLPGTPDRDVLESLSHSWTRWPRFSSTTESTGRQAAERVREAPADKRATARAEVLRDMLLDIAEATNSDVAMARGPRDLFFVEDTEARNPLTLSTNDFYCCVVPSADFADRRFGQEPALDKILSAYSARMRFNSWHYLPHVLDLTGRERDDWFYAPTMPDLTHNSEWHHTGHVKFGVRYAIRVPLRVALGGREFPGLYDLRLMRATGDPFTAADLEVAVAFGQVLRGFHEETYDLCRDKVTEFDNAWFRSTYAG